MCDKQSRLNQLRNSGFFPDEHIESYEKDYDKLAEKEMEQVQNKLESLQRLDFSLDQVKNAVLSRMNAQLNYNAI